MTIPKEKRPKYGAPTEFLFGANIHDFDPDSTSGKRKAEPELPCWYERSPEMRPDISSLVSEIKQRITALTQFVKEEGTLITYKDDQGKGTKRGESSTLPTLKPENMTFEKRSVKILATRKANGRFGEQVALKVVYASQTWLWYQSITKSNKVLEFLVAKFGPDETTWAGSEFVLFLEHDEFDNKNRPAVELSSSKKAK